MVMATADVASLYTNIDHQGAMKVVKWALKKNTNIERKHRRFGQKSKLLRIKHNYVWYENIYYLQIRGVAMGEKFVKMGGGRCFI